MNPSSLEIDIWLRAGLTACAKSFAIRVRPSYSGGARLRPSVKAIAVAQGSAVQRQKDMNRNRLGDELCETNKWGLNPDRKYDEGSHAVAVA
jgi:hypothetical protein